MSLHYATYHQTPTTEQAMKTALQQEADRLEAIHASQATSLAMADTRQRYEVEQVEKAKLAAQVARTAANAEFWASLPAAEANALLKAVVPCAVYHENNLSPMAQKHHDAVIGIRAWAKAIRGEA